MTRAAVLALSLLVAGCQTLTAQGPPLSPREEAQVLLQRGDGARALPLLLELQAQQPGDLTLARMVAEAHTKAGSGDAFLASLAKSDTALSHYQQGLVRFAKAADASAPAIAEFRRAVALDPAEPEFRFRLGVALLESEQYPAARLELEAAVGAVPNRPSWALPLAKARHRTGDDRGAIDAIRSVVMGNPTAADIRTARSLMDQIADPFAGFPRSARGRLEQALQWLEAADVPQQAIERLEEILRDHPNEPAVHALLGLAWAKLDDAGRAIEELKRAIELAPHDGKNHLYLAELYEGRQKPKVAEIHYRKALELNPMLDSAWLKLGDAALESQDYSAAARDFEVATRLQPRSAAARGKLALVHQLDGNWQAAERELKAILEHEPENVEFMLRLGVLHVEHFAKAKSPAERTQASANAEDWLQKVLQAQPENAIASRALARLRSR